MPKDHESAGYREYEREVLNNLSVEDRDPIELAANDFRAQMIADEFIRVNCAESLDGEQIKSPCALDAVLLEESLPYEQLLKEYCISVDELNVALSISIDRARTIRKRGKMNG